MPAPQHAGVRAEELVARARREVAAPAVDVGAQVGGVVHGVDVGQRPLLAREFAHARDVVDGAAEVAGRADRDESGLGADFVGGVVEVE